MFKRFKNLKIKTLLVHLIVTLAYPAAKAITSEDHGLLVFCDVLTIVAGVLLIAGVVYGLAIHGDFDVAGARVLVASLDMRSPEGVVSPLTPRELALLRLLAAHPGQVLSRDFLLNAVWGVTYYRTTRTLDQHIANLRRKLGSAAGALETSRGAGYRLSLR